MSLKDFLSTVDPKAWDSAAQKMVHAILAKQGIHTDELENFNSYLPRIIELHKEHVVARVVDKADQLHTIELEDVNFILPYEDKFGLDNPERALMRKHYEAEVVGLVKYTIRVKDPNVAAPNPSPPPDVAASMFDAPPVPEEDDDHEEDEEMEETHDTGPNLREHLSTVATIQEEDEIAVDEEAEAVSDEEAEEEEEEVSEAEDEDEEQEDGDEDEGEDSKDVEHKTVDDEEVVAEDEEEEEEEEEEPEDMDMDMDTDGREPSRKTKSNKAKSTTSNGATTTASPFFIQRHDYSSYTTTIFTARERHKIMDMPSFLGSNLCWMSTPFRDPHLHAKPYLLGCNYVVSRTIKLLPYEETRVNNRIFLVKMNPAKVQVRSKFIDPLKRERTNCTFNITMEWGRVRKNQGWFKCPRFLVEVPHEKPKRHIAVVLLAMAYGWSLNDFVSVVRMFLHDERSSAIDFFLTALQDNLRGCTTQKDAIQRVGQSLTKCKTMDNKEEIASYVSHTLRGEFLPNLISLVSHPTSEHFEWENLRKGYALAEAVAKHICSHPMVTVDKPPEQLYLPINERDYRYKVLVTPAANSVLLIRKFLKHYAKKAESNLAKLIEGGKPIDLDHVFSDKIIKLTAAIKNGNWDSSSDVKEHNQNKTCMMITGFCSDACHAQVQKIVKFSQKKNTNAEALLTDPTQLGRVCIYLTPESEKCAINGFKAIGCFITPLVDEQVIQQTLNVLLEAHAAEFEFVWMSARQRFMPKRYTTVKDVYGGVIGWTGQPQRLYDTMRNYRRRGALWYLLGLEWDRRDNMFYFCCNEGRMCRPLVILQNLPQLLECVQSTEFRYGSHPVKYLLHHGLIEYLDAAEEYSGMVFTAQDFDHALKLEGRHTHLEIHAVLSFSMTVAKAFMNHNQGPRRMYTGNMVKRSLGLKIEPDRGTTASFSLWYANLPLVSDPVDEALQLRETEPNGTMVDLAILTDEFTPEDSFNMNQDSIDRGLFVSTETNIVTESLGANQIFGRPDQKTKGCAAPDKYAGLNEDGTPKLHYTMTGGMAVVGRMNWRKNGSEIQRRCMSRFLQSHETYTVVAVDKYPDSDVRPPSIIRVSLSKVHVPTIGDKFFFAHAQKGTISQLTRAYDLPFYESGPRRGLSPQVLTNVACLSRTTMGLPWEMTCSEARAHNPGCMSQYQSLLLSKASQKEKLEVCRNVMKEAGMSYTGRKSMINGQTGKQLWCDVYTGFAYCHVLKHMAENKLRSRERGAVCQLTRQTSVGKRMSGGQRAGVSEMNNLYSYGASATVQSLFHDSADAFVMYVCKKCQIQAIGNAELGVYHCTKCKGGSESLLRVNSNYITNLTFQELAAAGFGHKLKVRPSTDPYLKQADEDRLFDLTNRQK